MSTLRILGVVLIVTIMGLPLNIVMAIPTTPDFDESNIRTTRDVKEIEPSDYYDITTSSQCAIKWFYDNNDVPSDSDVYVRVVGSFFGGVDTSQNMKIYINGVVKKGNSPLIYAHDYFGNTETKNFAQQEARISIGKKNTLGLRTGWNSILILDMGSLSNKENVRIRVDKQWPHDQDYNGATDALKRSYWNSNLASSTCINKAQTSSGKVYLPNIGELMMYMQYERTGFTSKRDDDSNEDYIWFDATDDHIEKRLQIAGIGDSTWGLVDIYAASEGTDNPPWNQGELKLSICPNPHSSSFTCSNHQYILDFPARTFNYISGQWGSVIVPMAAFQDGNNRDYYFMLYKTTNNYQKETIAIQLSTQACGSNCYSRWQWFDGNHHGDWTYNSPNCQGEIMMRWRTITQEVQDIYKDYTIVAPTRYGPTLDLTLDGPNMIDNAFSTHGWRRNAYYQNVNPGSSLFPEQIFGENYGGSVEGAGDTSDFVYVRVHGDRSIAHLGLDQNKQYKIVNDDLIKDGYNYDAEWLIIYGCDALLDGDGGLHDNGQMLLYYSRLHAIYGFKVDVLASSETTFNSVFPFFLFGIPPYTYYPQNSIQDSFHLSSMWTFGPEAHYDRGWYRQSSQYDYLWNEGMVAPDKLSGDGDVMEFEP